MTSALPIADAEFDQRLELFFGEAAATQCRIYARLRLGDGLIDAPAGMTLTGSVNGPFCQYAHTLPADLPLVSRGSGESILAEAILPEPCFWTPDMPHRYRVRVELRCASTTLAATERWLGIRPLGVAGRNLVYDAKRFVLRGMHGGESEIARLADWREQQLALVAANPSDELCDTASRLGVLIVADLELDSPLAIDLRERTPLPSPLAGEGPGVRGSASNSSGQIPVQLRRLSRHAAVGVAILPRGAVLDDPPPHNLVLAERIAVGHFSSSLPSPHAGKGPGERGSVAVPSPWAKAVVCRADRAAEFAQYIADCHLPVLAERRVEVVAGEPIAGRAACDQLQQELAASQRVSSYIV